MAGPSDEHDLTRASGGCCHVDGKTCPLRWLLVGGHVYDVTGNVVGTVDEESEELLSQHHATGKVTFLCRAAVEVLAIEPSRLQDREAFEEAWKAHPEYVELVRPYWATLERGLGMADGALDCPTWQGTPQRHVCFREVEE